MHQMSSTLCVLFLSSLAAWVCAQLGEQHQQPIGLVWPIELQKKYPALTSRLVTQMQTPSQAPASLAEESQAREHIIVEGLSDCPTWDSLQRGLRPEIVHDADPGE